MKPATLDAYRLMHEGALAFSKIEAAGMRIDTEYLQQAKDDVDQQLEEILSEIKQQEVYRVWKKQYGRKMNLDSGKQLGKILFDVMEMPCTQYTTHYLPSTDESHLSMLDDPFIDLYLEHSKLQKLRSTFLDGVEREICNGYIHFNLNLHTTKTFRSSSDSPNVQQIPVRNQKISKIIRSAFIPRNGRVLIEFDYSQIEVRIACSYHQDPRMLKYIANGYDFHSELARQLYFLDADQVNKGTRGTAKGAFVFAEFYGDYYLNVARNLWDAIDRDKLTCGDVPLKQHLKSKGIKRLGDLDLQAGPQKGSFVDHVRAIETDFWENRFKVYGEWRRRWWDQYQERGYLRTKTGFVVSGLFKRNEVINSPIQGSAFHCLLWSLIQIQKKLRRYKLKSIIIGQIHDSLIMDVVKSELKQVCQIVRETMVDDLMRHWSWIITPIEVEAEIGERNWYEKKKLPLE